MVQELEHSKEGAGWSLEAAIAEWRSWVGRQRTMNARDADELEDHLRSQAGALVEAGLSDDEAFLIAVKRIGELDAVAREFAREHSERLWKRLVVAPGVGETRRNNREGFVVAVALAVAAAVAVKVPELFGLGLRLHEALPEFYLRNLSLFVLPFLAALFAWKRALPPRANLWLAVPFTVGAIAVNLMPFSPTGSTWVLAALHLPMALWLAVGVAYTGGRWRDHKARMNFLRFSGEWFIYYVLIALGGGVLMAVTAFVFEAIGVEAGPILFTWILPCGAAGAVLIAAWLVEAKQSAIENMAPVLTITFTPLFTAMLLVFLAIWAWSGSAMVVERDVLIGFDLLLALIAALVLYTISAREPMQAPGLFDALQLLLIICALLVDGVALAAIAARIDEFGFSPNKIAALGENLILLLTLGRSAVLYARFLAGRGGFATLERWQTAYLPVYAAWAWVVVLLFPPLFSFR